MTGFDADNHYVFPEYSANLLMPSIFLTPVPLDFISLTTPAMMHILVSVAIRHRLYRVASNAGARDDLVKLRSKFYHHRGKAITALNDEILNLRNPYYLMVSAVMFVFAEVCGCYCLKTRVPLMEPYWLNHVRAAPAVELSGLEGSLGCPDGYALPKRRHVQDLRSPARDESDNDTLRNVRTDAAGK